MLPEAPTGISPPPQTSGGSTSAPLPATLPTRRSRVSHRGFASMSPERQREIARMGGKAVKSETRSFSKDRALAQAAGRKGGRSVKPEDRSYSRNRALAAAAGRKGGLSVPPERRTFSTDVELAKRAGRKGGKS